MKKMKLTRSLLAACSIVALTAVMYGCVHDGGDDTTTDDTDMTMPMPVAVDLSGIASDAMVEAGSADIAAGMSADIGEVTFTCASGGDDCSVTVGADGNAEATGGTVTAANSAAYTMRKAAEAAAAEAAKAAKTAEAKTKLDAIMAEGGQTTDAGLGGTGVIFGTADGNYDYTIKRDRMATTVTVTAHGATDDDDVKFLVADMDVGAGNTMLTRTHDADTDGNVMTEVAFISTDIAAPRAVEFAKFEAEDGTTPQALDVMADDGQAPAGTEVADALDIGADQAANVMPERSTINGTLNYSQDNPDSANPTPDVDEGLHAGTYNDADGMFRCAGTAACTIVFDDKGKVTSVTGDWVFIPAKDATTDQPDYDYLSWGFWLKKTKDAMDVTEYDEVQTFAMAHGMADSTGTITGSASYSGGATGVYVHNALSSGGGTVESRTAGHFTADASLMAYFGQTTADDPGGVGQIPPNKLNTITGTINNFMLSGGEAQDWSVALKGDVESDFTIGDGTANGGGVEGSLSGQFHGQASTLPGAVTGEFNANFSNGAVAGAFGANKD